MSDFTKLLDGATADTAGTETGLQVKQAVGDLTGMSTRDTWTVFCTGTPDGATVTLEFGPTKTGPWLTDTNVTFANTTGAAVTTMSRNAWVRGQVASAGASTDVNLYIG